jgi:hypothetical protein
MPESNSPADPQRAPLARRLCAHADEDVPGRMHWLEAGERCPYSVEWAR